MAENAGKSRVQGSVVAVAKAGLSWKVGCWFLVGAASGGEAGVVELSLISRKHSV